MKKEKKIRITPKVIKTLTRAQGLELTPDELGEILDPGIEVSTFVEFGCVDWMHYGTSSTDLTSVILLDRFGDSHALVASGSDGTLAENLSDYRELIERAANFGQAIVFEVKVNRIQQATVFRCGCPCDEYHASAFPTEEGFADNVADGVDNLDNLRQR